MTWLESHQSLRDHPKTRKLARTLGVSLPEAIGLLHCLWWWCLDYARDGDLTNVERDVIADACEWTGDPDALIDALVGSFAKRGGSGFIDNGDGLKIHDWYEYAGELLARREKDRIRKRESRLSGGRPSDGARTAHVPTYLPTNLNSARPVDNSTNRARAAGQEQERTCWRCGNPISGDAILDDLAVLSKKGIRHKECTP